MMRRVVIVVLVLAVAPLVYGQAPVIRSGDMFNEAGLYYRAYAHDPGSSPLSANYFTVTGQMGTAGPDKFWDFSAGPTAQIQRYDYLGPTEVPEAADFPLATVVERKTVEGGGDTEWLMFEPVPGVGRRVHGAVTEVALIGRQPLIFSPPPIDFPDTINYEDAWNNDFSFEVSEVTGVDPDDPSVIYTFEIRQTYSQRFVVDAWGIIRLPQLGLLPALRVNGEQSVVSDFFDDQQGWVNISTDYSRVYYWLSPGRGIVAQLQSRPYTSTAPDNFDQALGFVRMFETNKAGSGNNDPQPVEGLQVDISNGMVLVEWNKAANTSRYQVEYSTNGFGLGDWQPLGSQTQNTYMFDQAGPTGEARFYRVISLP